MRPKPFQAEAIEGGPSFIRNRADGRVWHRVQSRVMYADTDRSGNVYHAHYLRYFELGRAALLRDVAISYRETEESGYIYPVVKTEVSYHHPLYYDALFWIMTRPAQLERVKVQFEYVITLNDMTTVVCTGFTRHCATNRKGTPVAVDDKTSGLWKSFPS